MKSIFVAKYGDITMCEMSHTDELTEDADLIDFGDDFENDSGE